MMWVQTSPLSCSVSNREWLKFRSKALYAPGVAVHECGPGKSLLNPCHRCAPLLRRAQNDTRHGDTVVQRKVFAVNTFPFPMQLFAARCRPRSGSGSVRTLMFVYPGIRACQLDRGCQPRGSSPNSASEKLS